MFISLFLFTEVTLVQPIRDQTVDKVDSEERHKA